MSLGCMSCPFPLRLCLFEEAWCSWQIADSARDAADRSTTELQVAHRERRSLVAPSNDPRISCVSVTHSHQQQQERRTTVAVVALPYLSCVPRPSSCHYDAPSVAFYQSASCLCLPTASCLPVARRVAWLLLTRTAFTRTTFSRSSRSS